MSRPALTAIVLASALLTGGCDMLGDMLGVESTEKTGAAREADGKAIGAACRHAARAIEDCYTLYRKAGRAAVFAGWRDMNDYMRENKIEPVAPQLATQVARAALVKAAGADADEAKPAAKPAADAKARPRDAGSKPHDS